MKNILVTGGAGFVGSHLCKRLIANGYKVTVIDNFDDFYSPQAKRNNIGELFAAAGGNPSAFRIHEGDIRDASFLNRVFDRTRFDCIIHLAARAGIAASVENPGLCTDVNLKGTLNMLEAAKDFNIQRFIFASSSSVYGNNSVPFREGHTPDSPISPYAVTKKSGELLCLTYHISYNISIACLRLFTIYGPGQRPDLAIHKFTKLILEEKKVPVYGDGSAARDYTYIDDAVDGIVKAMQWLEKAPSIYEIINLGNSRTVSTLKMLGTIEEALGKKAIVEYLPSQPWDVRHTCADISKAKSILGYNPTMDFCEGVKRFIDWFKARGTA